VALGLDFIDSGMNKRLVCDYLYESATVSDPILIFNFPDPTKVSSGINISDSSAAAPGGND